MHLQHGTKNSCMFEIPAFLPPTNLGLLMHSPLALMEHVSLNLARLFFARPCRGIQGILKPVVHHQYLLLEIMFISMFTITFRQPGR